jgi:hypothetical protein
MARVEEQNPACYWDIFANRSSGQFPDGTPIELIANSANYQYGNPYPELDEEGIGIHPITKRDQGGLSFNTNLGGLGLSVTTPFYGTNPDTKVDVVLPGAGSNVTDIVISAADQEAQAKGFASYAEMLKAQAATQGDPVTGGIMNTLKNPWVLGAIALAAIILIKK